MYPSAIMDQRGRIGALQVIKGMERLAVAFRIALRDVPELAEHRNEIIRIFPMLHPSLQVKEDLDGDFHEHLHGFLPHDNLSFI